MSAPDDMLAWIKDDLGITDPASDAWLQRHLDGIWARMEKYTSRRLSAPPQQFVDDWGDIALNGVSYPMPPVLWQPQGASVFLRHFPVATIDAVTLNDSTLDATLVRFDPNTGKLVALDSNLSCDLSQTLLGQRARVTYSAGWASVPMDLYEIALGALQPIWSARQVGAATGAPGSVSVVTVNDVGSVELATGSGFVQAATKGVGVNDPLLGPWLSMLDLYIDHRSRIGHSLMPTTREVVPAPQPTAG